MIMCSQPNASSNARYSNTQAEQAALPMASQRRRSRNGPASVFIGGSRVALAARGLGMSVSFGGGRSALPRRWVGVIL